MDRVTTTSLAGFGLLASLATSCTSTPAPADAAPACEAGTVSCEGEVAVTCASGASRRVDCAAALFMPPFARCRSSCVARSFSDTSSSMLAAEEGRIW